MAGVSKTIRSSRRYDSSNLPRLLLHGIDIVRERVGVLEEPGDERAVRILEVLYESVGWEVGFDGRGRELDRYEASLLEE